MAQDAHTVMLYKRMYSIAQNHLESLIDIFLRTLEDFRLAPEKKCSDGISSYYAFQHRLFTLVAQLRHDGIQDRLGIRLSGISRSEYSKALLYEIILSFDVSDVAANHLACTLVKMDLTPFAGGKSWDQLLTSRNKATMRLVYGRGCKLYRRLKKRRGEISRPFEGPETGLAQLMDLLSEFPAIADHVYRAAGVTGVYGVPPRATNPLPAGTTAAAFLADANNWADHERIKGYFCMAGLLAAGILVSVISAGAFTPAVAVMMGAGVGLAQGSWGLMGSYDAYTDAQDAMRIGAGSQAQVNAARNDVIGSWGAMAVDVATFGLASKVGARGATSALTRGFIATALGSGSGALATAANPNVWQAPNTLGLIFEGAVVGSVGAGVGMVGGAYGSRLLSKVGQRAGIAVPRPRGGALTVGDEVLLYVDDAPTALRPGGTVPFMDSTVPRPGGTVARQGGTADTALRPGKVTSMSPDGVITVETAEGSTNVRVSNGLRIEKSPSTAKHPPTGARTGKMMFASGKLSYSQAKSLILQRTRVLGLAAYTADVQRTPTSKKFFARFKNDPAFAAWAEERLAFADPQTLGGSVQGIMESLLGSYKGNGRARPPITVALDDAKLKVPTYANDDMLNLMRQGRPGRVEPKFAPPKYDLRMLELRKGDSITAVSGTTGGQVKLTLGRFLGAGNATHVYELANDPNTVVRIPFLAKNVLKQNPSHVVDHARSISKTTVEMSEWYSDLVKQRKAVHVSDWGKEGEYVIATKVNVIESGDEFVRRLSRQQRVSPEEQRKLADLSSLMDEVAHLAKTNMLKAFDMAASRPRDSKIMTQRPAKIPEAPADTYLKVTTKWANLQRQMAENARQIVYTDDGWVLVDWE